MKKEIDYFIVDGDYGWNQYKFNGFFMREGGCASVTACDSLIYMKKYKGVENAYPYEVSRDITKEEYKSFSKDMQPILRPRITGVDKLETYIKELSEYLDDKGIKELSMSPFFGEESFDNAKKMVKSQIDAGYPIPYLNLRHKNVNFKDYVWHWFILGGYEIFEDEFYVKIITYGRYMWVNFKELWETGFRQKGGMIIWEKK